MDMKSTKDKPEGIHGENNMEHGIAGQPSGPVAGEDSRCWVTAQVRRKDLMEAVEGGPPATGEDPEGFVDIQIRMEDLDLVEGDESWGPVTSEDPKVWVTVF
jgi:hypothetical protein